METWLLSPMDTSSLQTNSGSILWNTSWSSDWFVLLEEKHGSPLPVLLGLAPAFVEQVVDGVWGQDVSDRTVHLRAVVFGSVPTCAAPRVGEFYLLLRTIFLDIVTARGTSAVCEVIYASNHPECPPLPLKTTTLTLLPPLLNVLFAARSTNPDWLARPPLSEQQATR